MTLCISVCKIQQPNLKHLLTKSKFTNRPLENNFDHSNSFTGHKNSVHILKIEQII